MRTRFCLRSTIGVLCGLLSLAGLAKFDLTLEENNLEFNISGFILDKSDLV